LQWRLSQEHGTAHGYEYLNGNFMHRGNLEYFCNHAGESDSSDSEVN
jgi:hypothetical protein